MRRKGGREEVKKERHGKEGESRYKGWKEKKENKKEGGGKERKEINEDGGKEQR